MSDDDELARALERLKAWKRKALNLRRAYRELQAARARLWESFRAAENGRRALAHQLDVLLKGKQ